MRDKGNPTLEYVAKRLVVVSKKDLCRALPWTPRQSDGTHIRLLGV
jgi:hypothetical protein